MKLIRCKIENFGCLSDLELTFEEGLHVLCRENGWGKSTLAAYIRAMFYGLAGDRKKSLEENERRRYKPWQGGVFGGSLEFEVRGRTYLVTRIFGDKESQDVFELRDAKTNRICSDYSAKLGEELFEINRDSFQRTFFIGQNACETAVNSDIHGKIGELVDNTRDLHTYEDALRRLTDKINEMNPNRVTGSIHRRGQEITELMGAVRREPDIARQLEEEEEQLLLMQREAEELKEDLAGLENLQLRESGRQRLLAEQEVWNGLRQKVLSLRQEVSGFRQTFPGRVPSLEEIEERIRECKEYVKAAQSMENFRLRQEEDREYRELSEHFADQVPTEAEFKRLIAQTTREARSFALSQQENTGDGRLQNTEGQEQKAGKLLMPIGGLLLLGAAGSFLLKNLFLGFALLLLGGGFLLWGFANRQMTGRSEGGDKTSTGQTLDDPIQRLEQLYRSKEQADRYRTLRRKKQDYLEAKADYETYRDEIASFLQSLDLEEEASLMNQLLALRDRADDYYDAVRDADRVQKELSSFERSHAVDQLSKPIERTVSLEQIGARLRDCRRKKQELDEALLMRVQRIERLRQDLDEVRDQLTKLQALMDRQEQEKQNYQALTRARDGLIRARENLTAQYTDPVFESFSYYYERLTGQRPDHFCMDGDTTLSFQEYGRQRPLASLSAGWRDLVGICLRLSLVDAMYQKEKPVLILDDPFVNLDDEKTQAAMRFLDELAETYQLIYITCREL